MNVTWEYRSPLALSLRPLQSEFVYVSLILLLIAPIVLLAVFAWLSDRRYRASTTRSRAVVGYAYLLVLFFYLLVVVPDPWVRIYWTGSTFTQMIDLLPFFAAGGVLVLLDRRSEEGYRSILVVLLAITIFIVLGVATVTLYF